MHILMTGGTGLIGRSFIERYSEYRYTVLTRSKTRAAKKFGANVQLINQLNELSNLDDFDAVINLAGEPIADKRWTDKQKQKLISSRLEITDQLVAMIERSASPPSVFLSGSAIGVYGAENESQTAESDIIIAKDFAAQLCLDWEQAASKAAHKTRLCLLRTGVVLSPKGGALKKMLPAFRLGLGGAVGHGQQYMSWIHIDDMLAAMYFLLSQPQISGPVNMTAPVPATNAELSAALAASLNRRLFFRIPAAFLQLALGEASSLLLGSVKVLPNRLQQHGYSFSRATIGSAFKELKKS
ncbi:TIGR01777 family oxidoreductase [Reinekea thalattae]|uniref:TIGR01777 family protein n=1 Tax=Reinekea thalattae TaxID=2593301 RepID=A0A5C8Z8R3_9GAMM|nr:TIGR01777 family oxidoreductase [Reinekea thalattae]TXR54322.1 TIGR01777 family protein [Reinekea thalattae]